MADESQLSSIARQAQILHEAAAILDQIGDETDQMIEDGQFGDGEEMEDPEVLAEDMETAEAVCTNLSMAFTMALADRGYVPDFDAPIFDDGADGDDDDPIAFQ